MQQPFSEILWPEARSAKLARMYNPMLLTDRADFVAVVHEMYEPGAQFIDPLVIVAGRENVMEQFWALRCFAGDSAGAAAVRWSLQAPISHRGTAISGSPGDLDLPRLSEPVVASPPAFAPALIPRSPSAVVAPLTSDDSSARAGSESDKLPIPAQAMGIPARPQNRRVSHAAGEGFTVTASSSKIANHGVAMRVEIVAAYAVAGLCTVRLR